MLSEILFLIKLSFAGNNLSLIFISIAMSAIAPRGGLLIKFIILAFILDFFWGFFSMRIDGHHIDLIIPAFLGSLINLPNNLIYYLCRLGSFFILIQLFYVIRIKINPQSTKEILSPYYDTRTDLDNPHNISKRRIRRLEMLMFKGRS